MGRKAKDANTFQAQRILTEAAVKGAQLIRRYISQRKGSVSGTKLKAAEIALAHALGTPRQKILLKTGALTMQDILELASQEDKNNGHKEGEVVEEVEEK